MSGFRLLSVFLASLAMAVFSTGSALAQDVARDQLVSTFEGFLDPDSPDLEAETARLTELVSMLTDGQVIDFNRSITNVTNNGLDLDLGMEELDGLQRAIDENFDRKDIQTLTKAHEIEAEFERQAQMFEDRAATTGKSKFLVKAEQARTKGEQKKEKQLAKIDRRSGMGSLGNATKAEKQAAKEARRAEKEARKAMRQSASKEAKRAEKEARRAMKEAQKEARRAAKEAQKEARRAAKNS